MKTNFAKLTAPRFLLVMLMLTIALGGTTSCKSKKKIAREQAAAEYAARVDQAKKDLTAILNDATDWSLSEKEARVATIKSWNLQDEEVVNLLDQVADKLARERADEVRKLEEERLKKAEEERLKSKANKYSSIENILLSIAAAPDVATANMKINQALQLFATPDAPVLIIISQAGGFNDYDRPTTIKRYLEYLKDHKIYNNSIEQVKYDASGKITELELIKQ
jgi:glutamate mutase epsilon subunit